MFAELIMTETQSFPGIKADGVLNVAKVADGVLNVAKVIFWGGRGVLVKIKKGEGGGGHLNLSWNFFQTFLVVNKIIFRLQLPDDFEFIL